MVISGNSTSRKFARPARRLKRVTKPISRVFSMIGKIMLSTFDSICTCGRGKPWRSKVWSRNWRVATVVDGSTHL